MSVGLKRDSRAYRQALVTDERGAAAILVASMMILLLGMMALAVDVGMAFNERRQDQSAVDSGSMAGALNAINGSDAMRDDALAFVRLNLPTTYSGTDWQTLWEGCVDPAAERNAGGGNFVALPAPAGWSVVDPANWCISFESARGLFRVRAPNQIVEAAFGRVLGVNQLETSAVAVAKVVVRGEGGILPFGVPFGAGGGGHICLSSGPSGQPFDPCTGGVTGNFGTLKGRKFGNPDIPTIENCNAAPLGQVLAENIAHGYDHLVIPLKPGNVEVRDECYNPLVNTLNTDSGFPNNGTETGLVGDAGGTAYGYTPRLALSGPTTAVFGKTVNDVPLWTHLNNTADYGGLALPTSDDAPADCDPSGFDGGMQDWDVPLDGIDDPNRSWKHMKSCIDQYVSGGFDGVMFEESIIDTSARFGYVPEFYPPPTLGTGNSWLPIETFRPVYLQATVWKSGMTYIVNNPGEPCIDAATDLPEPCVGAGFSMRALTAFAIPDKALPESLRGSFVTPGAGVNPYEVELYD